MNNIQLYSTDKWRFVTMSMNAEFVYSLLDGDMVIVTNVFGAELCADGGMPNTIQFPPGAVAAKEISSFTRKIGDYVWEVTLYSDERRNFFFHQMEYKGYVVAANSTVSGAANVTEALTEVDRLLGSLDLDRLSAGQGQIDCGGRTVVVQSESDFILNCKNENNLLFVNHEAFLVVTAGSSGYSAESLQEPLAQLDCDLLQAERGGEFLVVVHGTVTGKILIGFIQGSQGVEVSYLLHSSDLDKAYNLDEMFSVSIAGEGVV